MKSIAERLLIKPGSSVRLIGPTVDGRPSIGGGLIGPLPERAITVDDGLADAVVVFVSDVSELRARLPEAAEAAGDDGLLWLAYPKLSSGVESDLSRDAITPLTDEIAGLTGVTLISIDQTWSAMRLRPSSRYRA
jgi:hypothetical protein